MVSPQVREGFSTVTPYITVREPGLRDPRVFALSGLVLGMVSVIAGYLPSRRVAHVDPLLAMRSE